MSTHTPHTAENLATPATPPRPQRRSSRLSLRILLLVAVGGVVALLASVAPRAQRSVEPAVILTNISLRKAGNGKIIYTIAADGALNRAQTWQDASGQHIVIYKGTAALRGALPPGVRVGRVSESLEIVLPARSGQSVMVQPRANKIDFVVSGDVADAPSSAAPIASARETSVAATSAGFSGERAAARPGVGRMKVGRDYVAAVNPSRMNNAREIRARAEQVRENLQERGKPANSVRTNDATVSTPNLNEVAVSAKTESEPNSAATVSTQIPAQAPANSAPAMPTPAVQINSPLPAPAYNAFNFNQLWVVLGASLCGVLALVVVRRRRQGDEVKTEIHVAEEVVRLTPSVASAQKARANSAAAKDKTKNEKHKTNDKKEQGTRKSVVRIETEGSTNGASQSLMKTSASQTSVARSNFNLAAPAVIFGAYQVDQEVGKLVRGEAHRLDVLCSRAADDRRAIEASLLKIVQSADAFDASRRKARTALEDYGFVARQCAALLLAPDTHDRLGAARTLSTIKSPTALQFLIEGLYDRDTAVRAEAVYGLGELRLPAAIGALLDAARRHTDVSPVLLSNALTACSVEALDFGAGETTVVTSVNTIAGELGAANSVADLWTGEITRLEPVETIVALPEWLEDETLDNLFERLDSADTEARSAAARGLAQFPVRRSVEALMHLAVHDGDSSVRAAAVTSLGVLDHESVFAPVVLRLVDDAREVRAAAARALSRLSFDRADAYTRVIEAADADTLREVAAALNGAGMTAQALDRLVSEDRRHAYEAFSLLSLLVHADDAQPLLDALRSHSDLGVQLALVRFLSLTGGARYVEAMNEIVALGGVSAEVSAAITDSAAKLKQASQELVEA